MCMEDVKIGRETGGNEVPYSVGASAIQILPNDPKRTSLILSPPIANTVTFGFTNSVASGVGMNLSVNSSPIVLNIKDHGELVTKPIFAIGSGAGTNGAIWYSSLQRES